MGVNMKLPWLHYSVITDIHGSHVMENATNAKFHSSGGLEKLQCMVLCVEVLTVVVVRPGAE